MGEIADMMIEGLLDEETGEYVGDINKQIFGAESPGFPVRWEDEDWRNNMLPTDTDKRTACPQCGKRVKPIGLRHHVNAKHGGTHD